MTKKIPRGRQKRERESTISELEICGSTKYVWVPQGHCAWEIDTTLQYSGRSRVFMILNLKTIDTKDRSYRGLCHTLQCEVRMFLQTKISPHYNNIIWFANLCCKYKNPYPTFCVLTHFCNPYIFCCFCFLPIGTNHPRLVMEPKKKCISLDFFLCHRSYQFLFWVQLKIKTKHANRFPSSYLFLNG